MSEIDNSQNHQKIHRFEMGYMPNGFWTKITYDKSFMSFITKPLKTLYHFKCGSCVCSMTWLSKSVVNFFVLMLCFVKIIKYFIISHHINCLFIIILYDRVMLHYLCVYELIIKQKYCLWDVFYFVYLK